MPAVTFDNTQNVGFIVANTAAPRRNLDISVPPGPAGDTIVVFAVGNTKTQTISMNVAGYTTFINPSGSADSSGEMLIAYKISNGRETSLSVKTDSSTTDSSFCAAVLRLKNTHRIYPLMGTAGAGSSPNTASDGVQISTQDTPVTKPVGDGSMLISFLAGGDGTAFLDGEQPAGHTLITKANTANARMMISYQMKSITNSYTTLAFANTAGRRRAVAFTVTPDTMAAGVKESFWGGGVSSSRTSAQVLQFDPRVSFLAREDEEIGEVGVRIGSIGGDGAGIEIGVYDVTNGSANAKLVGAQTVNTLLATSAGTYRQIFYPPIKLTPGRRYSTGFRTNSSTTITTNISYLGTGAARLSSQNGSVALPSSWDFDSGTTNDSWYNMFALVRNNRKAHVSSYKFFQNTVSGTAHSTQFPLYPGGSRKIILMGYSENQTATMNAATIDGQSMTLINNYTVGEDFCIWYYDVPDSGQIQDFTTYTEFDPLSDLTLTGTNQININTMAAANPGETGYRLDLGPAGKPGDFRYRIGPINVSAASSDLARFSIFTFSETVSAQGGTESKSLHVRWTRTVSGSNSTLQLAHFATAGALTTNPTASASYTGPGVFLNTDFYVDISRVGSSAFCSIYADSAYKNLVTTLSIPLSDSIAYRYLYFASVWSTGTTSTATATIKNAYYMIGDAGNKTITMSTPQATDTVAWHAWQINRAAPGAPANTITTVGLGLGNNVSNTIAVTENSMLLATVASSSPARVYSWNADVITDRQELDETNHTTATADELQFTGGNKTVTATASGTEGNKYLGLVTIDTVKSKNKIKTGFVG